MDEGKLTQKLRRGDRLALDRAIEAYTPYLSTVAWRALGASASREDVEEVVSDAFLALWEHRAALDPAQGVKSYLSAIARNKATDRLRAARPAPLPLADWEAEPGPGPEELVERHMFAERLRLAVEALDEPDRTLVIGYYYEGERLKDIGKRLGLSVPAAKTRLCRARRDLKERLTKGGSALEPDG